MENIRKSTCRYLCVRILNAASFIAEDAEDKAWAAGAKFGSMIIFVDDFQVTA